MCSRPVQVVLFVAIYSATFRVGCCTKTVSAGARIRLHRHHDRTSHRDFEPETNAQTKPAIFSWTYGMLLSTIVDYPSGQVGDRTPDNIMCRLDEWLDAA